MLRSTAFVCPWCEVRALARPSLRPQWQQRRSMAQVQKRRPDRMTLSPSVAKGPGRAVGEGRKPARRNEGPFAAMNRTRAGARVESERQRREEKQAQQKTTTTPRRSSARTSSQKKRADRQPGDMKALKMQQALTKVSYGQRNAVKSRISDIESFQDFPLLPVVQESIPQEALKGLVDISPTPIQRLAVPALLGTDGGKRRAPQASQAAMQRFLLAAETGSGKTLAYLLPVVDAIKRAEIAEAEDAAKQRITKEEQKKGNVFELEPPPLADEAHPSAGRPRAIVLLPTSELVDQVGRIFKKFSHTVKLRVSPISVAYSAAVIRNRLFGPAGVDVVISTPHLLSSITESDPNILSRVTHLVVDEADSLLDRSFSPITSSIIDRATPSLKQLILCSATIPRSLDSFLQKRFPDIVRLATPNLHAIPRRVQLGVVDIDREPYRGNRDLACADTLWSIGREASNTTDETRDIKRVIVFVNEREKATELAKYLVTKGVDAVALNRDTAEERRGDILDSFTSPGTSATVSADRNIALAKAGHKPRDAQRVLTNVKVIVMTDIGARGIDTVNVRHVVLYEMPHTVIDVVHRLGRTGRMGRRGKGIVLVGKDDRKDIVREIREGMYRGQALI